MAQPSPGETGEAEVSSPLLSVTQLSVRFPTRAGVVRAVDEVSFEIEEGERVAVVGESGSGKSVTALSVLGLIDPPGQIVGGAISFAGTDLTKLRERDLVRVRGREVGLILQDPLSALDPLKTVGSQISESLRLHEDLGRREAQERTLELLRQVRISDPERRITQYAHELAGGMNQRVTIASALACHPRLLIADEPTSALDATTAAGVLELLAELAETRRMAVMLITHDLGAVARFADRVVVMYAGRVVERGTVGEIFRRPRHPYTRGLLDSVPGVRGRRAVKAIPGTIPNLISPPSGCVFHPRCFLRRGRAVCSDVSPALEHRTGPAGHLSACHFAEELEAADSTRVAVTEASPVAAPARNASGALLRVDRIVKDFDVQKRLFVSNAGTVRAVDDVSFEVDHSEVLAIVGESGSGKSTTARIVLGLERPTSGTVLFHGQEFHKLGNRDQRQLRRQLQVVFQDPDGSLDPRMKVADIISEPLRVQGVGTRAERRRRVVELLDLVGLKQDHANRYPRDFSGGQRQRIAIARALALEPDLLVCDEPVTALDVSIQAQILNLLQEIQSERGLSYLFIAHDLSVVRQIAHRVAVMYLGQIVELAGAEDFFRQPHHPYAVALLSAMQTPDPEVTRARERIVLQGTLPSPFNPPSGCRFHTRCWKAQEICGHDPPPLAEISSGRWVSCHFPESVDANAAGAAAARSGAA